MSSAALLLTPGVLPAIRCEAFRAWRSLRRFGFESQDIRQEFFLHLVHAQSRYEARRSSPVTFTTHVCRHRSSRLVEAATCVKWGGGVAPRSLAEPVKKGERHGATIMAELADTISDDAYAMRTGRRSRSFAELLTLRIDVNRAIARLPTDLADVANLLASGMPVVEVARQLQISRATLYRRIGQLRWAFRESGLHGYVALKEAA
jgi:DNA-directed RNA polymerase specialized sigma24 family protein